MFYYLIILSNNFSPSNNLLYVSFFTILVFPFAYAFAVPFMSISSYLFSAFSPLSNTYIGVYSTLLNTVFLFSASVLISMLSTNSILDTSIVSADI